MNIPLGLVDKLIGTQLSPQPRFLVLIKEVLFEEVQSFGLALNVKFDWAVRRLPDGTYADSSQHLLGQIFPVDSASELRVGSNGQSYVLDNVTNLLYNTKNFVFYEAGHPGFVGNGSNPSTQ